MKKEVNIDITTSGVAENMQLISQIGSGLGKPLFKVDVRMAWQGGSEGFERDKAAIASGEKKGFILNRSPRRILIKNILITGAVLTRSIDDELIIGINPHEDDTFDLTIPVDRGSLNTLGKTTMEAIGEAIHGQKDHFFIDGKSLVKIVNDAIEREITHLESHITACQKMLTTLKGDKYENEKKVKICEDAWIKSAVSPDLDLSGGKAVVTVIKDEE